jgi:hypothetical protein
MSTRLLGHALALALTTAVACDASPDTDADAPSRLVSAVTFDGFIVLEEVGPREKIISIFDPNTGKSSEGQAVLHRAISPDGRHLAWFATDGQLVIARPTRVGGLDGLMGGAPTLEILHRLTAIQSPIRWVDDTALVTDFSRVDITTGVIRTCQDETQFQLPIVPVLGTDDHLCAIGNSTLHRYVDGAFAGSMQGSGTLSPDGQFLGHSLHVPSGVLVNGLSDAFPLANTYNRFPIADGREILLPGGGHGEVVYVEFSGLETVFKRGFVDAMPLDGRALDYAQIYTSGIIDHDDTRWNIEKALRPWFDKGKGRRYRPLFVRPDGASAIYSVISHVVELDFVGENVGQEPSLAEIFVASALVEVFPDGTSRGFLTSETAHDAVVLGSDGLHDQGLHHGASSRHVDLGTTDWLVPGYRRDSLGSLREAMWGYRNGRPIVIDGHAKESAGAPSIISPDGRWLIGVGDPAIVGDKQPICLRDLTDGPARCVAPGRAGYPIGVVGQGYHTTFADAPPLLLGLSRIAAPIGSIVDIYGAHFGETGDSGTLEVGSTTLPSTDILSWSPHRIRIRLTTTTSPGLVRITTPHGTTSGRAIHLGTSPSATPPFAGVPLRRFALGQGVNYVDLGDLGAPGGTSADFSGNTNAPTVRLTPETRLPDGRFALVSTGGDDEPFTVTVRSGVFSRILDFVLQDRLAADDGWQLVLPHSLNEDRFPRLMTLAGDLVERSQGVHPKLENRFSLASLPNRNPVGGATGQEVTEYYRTDGDDTYVSLGYQNVQLRYPGWPMRKLLGFTAANGTWGVAQYATTPQLTLPNYHRHFAVDGDTLLVVGADPNGTGGPHYALSHDGGVTLGPGTFTPQGVLPTTSALVEPIAVHATTGTFFLVFEIPLDSIELLGVHAITPSGAFEADVIDAPPNTNLSGYSRIDHGPLAQVTDGGRVLVHFGSTNTLMLADFDADPSEWAWTTVPSAADAGQIRSFYHDPSTDDVIAIRMDGTLSRATRAGAWADWSPLDLQIDLGIPIEVHPMVVGKLPDGRWAVNGRWLAPSPSAPNTPSVYGPAGWLIGPR